MLTEKKKEPLSWQAAEDILSRGTPITIRGDNLIRLPVDMARDLHAHVFYVDSTEHRGFTKDEGGKDCVTFDLEKVKQIAATAPAFFSKEEAQAILSASELKPRAVVEGESAYIGYKNGDLVALPEAKYREILKFPEDKNLRDIPEADAASELHKYARRGVAAVIDDFEATPVRTDFGTHTANVYPKLVLLESAALQKAAETLTGISTVSGVNHLGEAKEASGPSPT